MSVLTPWNVQGKIVYNDLIKKFGTSPIDGSLIKRWETVTKTKAHHFIRRGLVFSHQDIEKILDNVEQGIPIYLYTGRGPSSDKMHLGHLVTFKLTKYLQGALKCLCFIQLSDDEKYLFKDGNRSLDLEKYHKYSYTNAYDIIACGFDPARTLLFSNLESNNGYLYFNNVLLMKETSSNSIKSTYGLGESLPPNVLNLLEKDLERDDVDEETKTNIRSTIKKFSNESSSVGQCIWPVFQCGPAFCTSFTDIFVESIKGALKNNTMPPHVIESFNKCLVEFATLDMNKSIRCLVPMAIDQSPYFRMARDHANVLNCPKPSVIHSEFLPGLQQGDKMSTTGEFSNSTIFLDMNPKDIAKVIKRNAFSGGKTTVEEHRKLGGDIKTDISYQYLTYFLESDEALEHIAQDYTSGNMLSGQIKELCANIVAEQVTQHQNNLALVTDDVVKHFFNRNRMFDIGGCYSLKDDVVDDDVDYSNYGINFDRQFGCKCLDE